ncbi:DNA-binding transcriptional regulator, LysR family [Pasteurella testudinis DSM 23072]|uniref:DNA-binding transcriptional regulator, LysR family n=1 Tax=Pasteurella testudinis DSM 23072 TaxID=1122938 RepID=A0A1W1USJ1_9PAST|nr:LysR family transcriptional regulator [Pasteurella testudinis]SMB84016.1 DNA-binding transcriptional regulator, LysR family [Pasteurella testudinis DSM 23072]SUB50928.1 putative transcriptional regulatory protein (LysR family) [Pasteurella testudinis]
MYSLEQLKIFVTVCEQGSFSAAARQLKRAQSGVSQAIANLEIEINQTLFDRDKNRLSLTETGQTLLPVAHGILQQTRYFEQKIDALARQEEHQLTLAVEESLLNDDLLAAMATLAAQFPITDIDIISASTFDIEPMVKSGQAQLGIVYKNESFPEEMDFILLGHNRFITVASPQHPLSRLSSISLSELQQHRQLVLRSIGKKALWFSQGITGMRWYANSHHVLAQLACENIGWTDLPEKLAEKYLRSGSLTSLKLEIEPDGNLIPIAALLSRRHQSGPVFDSLLNLLKQYWK